MASSRLCQLARQSSQEQSFPAQVETRLLELATWKQRCFVEQGDVISNAAPDRTSREGLHSNPLQCSSKVPATNKHKQFDNHKHNFKQPLHKYQAQPNQFRSIMSGLLNKVKDAVGKDSSSSSGGATGGATGGGQPSGMETQGDKYLNQGEPLFQALGARWTYCG